MGWSRSTELNIAGKKQKCVKMFRDKKFMAYLDNLVSEKIVAKSGQEIAKSDIKNVISRLGNAGHVTMPWGEFGQAEDLYRFFQEWNKNE